MLIGAFETFAMLARERLGDDCPAFLPGADHDDLTKLETTLGRPLPPELRSLLAHSGGQADGVTGPLNFMRFLRPEEISAMHAMIGEVVESWPAEQPSSYSAALWTPAWIPFMAFQNDAYCIDTEPGTAGTYGQVFIRPNVPDLAEPLATSLAAFLEIAAAAAKDAQIRLGSFTVQDLF